MAQFTFNIEAYVNQPPSSVGDNEITISNSAIHIFTRNNFTTETTPAYADPEGDIANNLKVTSLPVSGKLKLNSVDVLLNDIIPFTSIDSGLLTYESDVLISSAHTIVFTFQISDTGSNTFV